jgi:hypothetical protein
LKRTVFFTAISCLCISLKLLDIQSAVQQPGGAGEASAGEMPASAHFTMRPAIMGTASDRLQRA